MKIFHVTIHRNPDDEFWLREGWLGYFKLEEMNPEGYAYNDLEEFCKGDNTTLITGTLSYTILLVKQNHGDVVKGFVDLITEHDDWVLAKEGEDIRELLTLWLNKLDDTQEIK
jgi:hypothetical protein